MSDLVSTLYLLERCDFLQLSNEEVAEVIIRESKYNLFSIKRGLWFEEDLELHDFVKATANKIRDEHIEIIDVLKYRA